MGVALGYVRIGGSMNLIVFELHGICFWKILLWSLIFCMKIGGLGMSPHYFLFNSRDTEAILKVSLSLGLPLDVRMWQYTSDGQLTVKSACHLGIRFMANYHVNFPTSSTYISS